MPRRALCQVAVGVREGLPLWSESPQADCPQGPGWRSRPVTPRSVPRLYWVEAVKVRVTLKRPSRRFGRCRWCEPLASSAPRRRVAVSVPLSRARSPPQTERLSPLHSDTPSPSLRPLVTSDLSCPWRPAGAPRGEPEGRAPGLLWPWLPRGQGSARLPLAALLGCPGPDLGGPTHLSQAPLPPSREGRVLPALVAFASPGLPHGGGWACVRHSPVSPAEDRSPHDHFMRICPKMEGCRGVSPAGAFACCSCRAQTWRDLRCWKAGPSLARMLWLASGFGAGGGAGERATGEGGPGLADGIG